VARYRLVGQSRGDQSEQRAVVLSQRAVGGSRRVEPHSDGSVPDRLGVPGPADGHVALIDAQGHVAQDQRTAGYPVLSRYDTGALRWDRSGAVATPLSLSVSGSWGSGRWFSRLR
jgi:hypothetical protein